MMNDDKYWQTGYPLDTSLSRNIWLDMMIDGLVGPISHTYITGYGMVAGSSSN